MITNHYAHNCGIVVDAVIPEPLFSNELLTTRWSKKSKDLSTVILCSVHQLPQGEGVVDDFVDEMQGVEVHFVLENLSGKGRDFLLAMIEEAQSFQRAKILNYREVNSYEALFQRMKG